jgi:U3 small nucleolar RNA-associated protein 14
LFFVINVLLYKYTSKRLRTEVVNDELDVQMTTKQNDNTSATIHKIKTHELLNSVKNSSDGSALRKLFSKAHKRTKVLDTPLPRFVSEKAQRIASYIEDKKEISKWDPVIRKNRQADQLVFPLKQPNYTMQTVESITKNWTPETDLEKQVAQILQTSDNNLTNQKLLTPSELKAVQAMNLDEMKQKRAEFLKLKALQSYQETKFKRLKNIKSKRYRKIMRKEKEKNEMKDLEKMEKEDPTQFKEVLKEMEKKRMMVK